MHILLIRFSSMGDVVLQTATVHWLRSLFGEGLRLSFLTSKEFSSLIEGHSEINQVISYDRRNEDWSELIKKISKLHQEIPIDLMVDSHATLRSFRLKLSFWTIPALTVDKRRWERFFLTTVRGLFFKRLINAKFFGLGTQIERIIQDFQNIFLDTRGVRRVSDQVKGAIGQLTSLQKFEVVPFTNKYIVLAPSASFKSKRWPVEKFIQLAQTILKKSSYDVVVLAGPDDKFCEAFNAIESVRFHNLQGKTSLRQSMGILEKAHLTIGNDSGMNHISEAYGVPCLTIFGPTDPRFGFAPHSEKSSYLSKELWCKPCSTTGKKTCFRDKLYCLEEITSDEVYDLFLQMETRL